jgi:alpha-glucoside transport system permease protein
MSTISEVPVSKMPVSEVPAKVKKIKAGKVVADSFNSKGGRRLVYVLAFLWSIPSFGFLVSSFRPEKAVKTSGWWQALTPPSFTLANYSRVLKSADGEENLWHFLLNSARITIPSVIISVGVAALAAYAFSWMEFKGRDWMYSFVTFMLVVPLQLCLVPILRLFTGGVHLGTVPKFDNADGNTVREAGILHMHKAGDILRGTSQLIDEAGKNGIRTPNGSFGLTIFPYLHLNNTITSLWIAHTIFGLPFCVFLLRTYMSGLPREIIEAAKVDGASHLKVLATIVLPLSVPAIASLVIFQFVYIWNDVLVGAVYGGSENTPIVTKMVDVTGTRGNAWHLLTAAGFISMVVPLAVFFALQRYFVKGLLAGSVKG